MHAHTLPHTAPAQYPLHSLSWPYLLEVPDVSEVTSFAGSNQPHTGAESLLAPAPGLPGGHPSADPCSTVLGTQAYIAGIVGEELHPYRDSFDL